MAAGIAIDHWSEIARRHGVDLADRTRDLYDVIGRAGTVPQTAYLHLFGDEGPKFVEAIRSIHHTPRDRAETLKLIMYDAALGRWRELINAE